MKKLIIIAEDYYLCKMLMKLTLEDFECPVLYADNGAIALELIKKNYHQFDQILLLTDIEMPVMDGFQLIRKIVDNLKKIKIVVVSCLDYRLIPDHIKSLIQGYVEKPIELSQIIEFLELPKKETLLDACMNFKELNQSKLHFHQVFK